MRIARVWFLGVAVCLVGCAGPQVAETASAEARGAEGDKACAPAAAVANEQDERVAWPALLASEPADGAPEGLAQFGRLVGTWECTSEQRQQDGSFAAGPNTASWTWFYTLGGKAVQDIWEPAQGAVGTNLRIYDAASDSWEIQWATGAVGHFERITAKADGDKVVMHGEVDATAALPAHRRRITFFDISADAFEWKYEATKPGGDSGWTEYSRLHCLAATPRVAVRPAR